MLVVVSSNASLSHVDINSTFVVRFYVDTIGLLRDTQTVELFYLNTRQALFRVGFIVAKLWGRFYFS